ncbi:MAG: potassium-transporting ATPase subunit KdpC [Proteobacteria bacterium]|nr:potassium-transporting ATPase subunit KdpC [Pseudomonadota bacterium]
MWTELRDTLRPAIVLLVLFTGLTGLAYPLAVTVLARLAFPAEAEGSLVRDGGGVRGSALIGQPFSRPGYFHGRPSAAGNSAQGGYDAANSSGSNLAPGAPELARRVTGAVAALRQQGLTSQAVPSDLVTTSASGLDPDISPEAAFFQVSRVARARGLDEARVRQLVTAAIAAPRPAFLGPPRVNVLALNRALDAIVRQTAPISAMPAR